MEKTRRRDKQYVHPKMSMDKKYTRVLEESAAQVAGMIQHVSPEEHVLVSQSRPEVPFFITIITLNLYN